MKRLTAAMLVVAALVPSVVQAAVVSSGGYQFNVRAVNRSYQEIYQARVDVFVSGTRATVTVRADGYREARESVWLTQGQTYYNVTVRLEDAQIDVRVRDAANQYIPGVWVDATTFGAFADEYRFTVRLRAEGFTKFGRNDVGLRVNHLWPFGERVWVQDGGAYRTVEVTLKRRDLTSLFNTVDVTIPSDAQLEAHRRDLARQIRFTLQNEPELDEARRSALLRRLAP